MDLVTRYLAAIRRNLPARRADDIIAELSDLLAAKIEDREAALGRPLTPAETEALIKDFGHPWVVAARYRDRQWLIGPDVFPFYLAVTRILLLIVAAVVIVSGGATFLFGGHSIGEAFAQTIGSLAVSLMINAGIVTLIFAILERTGFPAEHLQRWNPAQLPAAEDKQPGPWCAAVEVAFSVAVLVWWGGGFGLPIFAGPGLRIEMAPIFSTLYWPILILIAVRLVHNLLKWLRPRWTGPRFVLGGGTALAGIALLAILYQAGLWAVVVPTGIGPSPADTANIQISLNLALRIAILVTAIVWAVQCLIGLWSFYRRRAAASPNA